MKPLTIAALATVLACAPLLRADPAGDLRELDRQLREGAISKSEYDRRWAEVIAEGMRPASAPRVPKAAVRTPAPRLPNEFSLSAVGAYVDAGDDSGTAIGATAMVGRFVTPHLQLSVGVTYDSGDVESVSYETWGGLGVIDYHFQPDATFTPFVGAGAGWVNVELESRDREDWYWTAHVGVKQQLNRTTALKYQVGYLDYGDLDLRGVAFTFGVCALF